jgi:hypothetical protein
VPRGHEKDARSTVQRDTWEVIENVYARVLALLVLGGVLGTLGQGIRVIVGLKKQSDESAAKGRALKDDFDGTQLGVSLFIGFVAGGLGIMTLSGFDTSAAMTKETAFTVVGIGYAGADFIEGFISKYLPAAGGGSHSDPQPNA